MDWKLAIPAKDRINLVNIGLMAAACAVALFIPFELFLFAYAVLGPAHYLTEISWLEKRGFFTRAKGDFVVLGLLAILMFVSTPPSTQLFTTNAALFTTLAFGSALVLMLTASVTHRFVGLLAVVALSVLLVNTFGFFAALMALFVPTLIHVYVFTGFFLIYGALKDRSRSGYAAFAVFVICPVLCLLVDPARLEPSAYVVVSYWKSFSSLNLSILGIDLPRTRAEGGEAGLAVFSSAKGLMVMRFIAFAYTYHYLNWFSKTSVIRWHEVGRSRLAAIAALWIGSVALYLYDYARGVQWLLCLSYMHVYLEFPLNHISILGTFSQLRSRLGSGQPAEAAMSPARHRR